MAKQISEMDPGELVLHFENLVEEVTNDPNNTKKILEKEEVRSELIIRLGKNALL